MKSFIYNADSRHERLFYNLFFVMYLNYLKEALKMKFIPGFDGNYSVTEDGKVFSHIRNRYRKIFTDAKGYNTIRLQFEGGTKSFRVHRLVALTYIDNPDNKDTVNHKDGDKKNNHCSNLEWMTHHENMTHAYNNGLIPKTIGANKYILSKRRPVICVTTGQRFDSMSECAREFNINPRDLHKSLKTTGYAYGNYYKYETGDITRKKIDGKRPIYCVETGETFESLSDCHRKTGIDVSNLSNIVRIGRKTLKGLSFKFLEAS